MCVETGNIGVKGGAWMWREESGIGKGRLDEKVIQYSRGGWMQTME